MSCVTCHVSGVRCQVSGVRCHVSGVMCQVSRVRYHMSGVTCQMSHVRCQVSGVTCQINIYMYICFVFFWDKVVELVGGGSVINRAYPV